MSTYLHLVCPEHTPHIVAEQESGQHLYDLPRMREDYANRDALIEAARQDCWPDDPVEKYFRQNTVAFMQQHPHCNLYIESELGGRFEMDNDSSEAVYGGNK